MTKISVILTTYNSGQFIERTIRSILGQVGQHEEFEIELIVVDDCSTDDTVELVNEFGLEILSTKKNSGGPNRGRNIGIDKATGDYICISDHDDEWHEHRVRTVLPYLPRVPIVTSGYTVRDVDSGKKWVKKCNNPRGYREFARNETFLGKLTRAKGTQNTYLGSIFYTSDLKHIKFEEEYGVVDYDWICSLFHQNSSLEICQSLYTRYIDKSNLSLADSYRKKDFDWSLEVIDEYRDAYPDEVKIAYRKIHGSMARYYYLMDDMNEARKYFRKSGLNWKTVAYYLTSYAGSGLVKRYVKVF